MSVNARALAFVWFLHSLKFCRHFNIFVAKDDDISIGVSVSAYFFVVFVYTHLYWSYIFFAQFRLSWSDAGLFARSLACSLGFSWSAWLFFLSFPNTRNCVHTFCLNSLAKLSEHTHNHWASVITIEEEAWAWA